MKYLKKYGPIELHQSLISKPGRIQSIAIQFAQQYRRFILVTKRSYKIQFFLIGIALFVSSILNSIYKDLGQYEIDFMDHKKTGRTITNLIGFSCYTTCDSFAAGLFANVISVQGMLPQFKREYKSGLYSPSTFYFASWLSKLTFLSFYPLILFGFMFHSLNLKD